MFEIIKQQERGKVEKGKIEINITSSSSAAQRFNRNE